MANDSYGTGAGQLAAGAKLAASNLAGPAIQLATGAGVLRTAADTIKGAAIDKLLGPTALFGGALIGVLRTLKSIVEQSGFLANGLNRIASIQQITGKFETLLKSAEAATARLKELYRFTASAPFDFHDIAEGNRVLEALAGSALSGAKGMTLVGDAAAATGQTFSETAERVGKLYNALRSGRSLDKIMFQLQTTGVVTDELARRLETLEQSGATFTEMWAEVEKSLSSTSGGMKNEMQSLDALSTRLANASKMMEQAFATPFVAAQAKAIENTIKATDNLTPVLARIGADIAPLIKFFANVKNSTVEATVATKGFGEAMMTAWTVAKGFTVALGGATIASFVGHLLKLGTAAGSFVSNLAKTRAVVVDYSSAVGELSKSQTLAAQAGAELRSANVAGAASLAAQALWARISAAGLNLHRTAMIAAKTSAGEFSLAQYAIAAGTQVLVGGFNLVKSAVMSAASSFAGFITAQPLLAVGAAALAAGYVFKTWADAISETNREYIDLIQNSAKATRALREQVAAVKNLDQYRAAMTTSDKEEARVAQAIKDLGPRPDGPDGADVFVDNATPAREAFDNKKAALGEELKRIRASRKTLAARDLKTLGLSKEEEQAAVENADKNRRLADAREQAAIDRADDATREKLLRKRALRLNTESMIGEDIAAGRLRPEAYKDHPTELMKINRQIKFLEDRKLSVPKSYIEKRADLANLANTHQEKAVAAQQDLEEANRLKDALRLKAVELDYDRAIADVRKRGGESSAGEAAKELAILEEQLRIVKEKEARGEASHASVEEVENQIAKKEGDMAQARAEAATERAKNNALVNRDPRAAQAIQDNADREKMRDRYRAIGLSEGQADSDFNAGIMAQAAQAPVRIVADSLQAVGGGGGSGGASPILAAQRRIIANGNVHSAYLKIIADAAGNKGGDTLR